jgi:hypothetical protein
MIRLVAGLATAALFCSPLAAHAQYQRNVITNSGNGANNTIIARNGGGIPLHAPQAQAYAPQAYAPQAAYAPQYQQPVDYGQQAGGYDPRIYGSMPNTLPAGAYEAYGSPAAQPSYGYAGYPGYSAQGYQGTPVSRNVIRDSGNGYGNYIQAVNRGGYSGYNPYAGGGFPMNMGNFGVNVNVIANSGNGVGNTITAGNGGQPGFTWGPNGININVVKNSGNGAGNTIKLFNR